MLGTGETSNLFLVLGRGFHWFRVRPNARSQMGDSRSPEVGVEPSAVGTLRRNRQERAVRRNRQASERALFTVPP